MSDAATSGNATAHTPGPWRVDGGSRDFPFMVRPGTTGGLVASVCESILWQGDHAQTEANARLIAAAPDLLAAIQRLMKESAAVLALAENEIRVACGHTNVACLDNAIHRAADAIKKARGE